MVRTFDTPITTNDQSIDRVLNAGLPVALVFLDGPAPAALDEAMNRIARAEAGKLLVAKVQRKDSPEAARRFGITYPPAIATYKNGQAPSKAEGILAPDFEKHVNFLLGKGPKPAAQAQQTASAASGGNGKPQPVSDASFDREVLQSKQPVLVDFWAPWCGPCRMTEPIVERLAHEMSGRMKVAKVNVDENPKLSMRYGVQSIPTMMLVKNGKIVDRWVGALPEAQVRMKIAPVIASP